MDDNDAKQDQQHKLLQLQPSVLHLPSFDQEIGISAQLAALHRCPFRTRCTLAKAAGVGCSSYRHKPQRQMCTNGTLWA